MSQTVHNKGGYPPPLKGVLHILTAGWISVVNSSRAGRGRDSVRFLFFGALGLGFMALSALGAHWLFSQFLQTEFLADLLIRRTLDIILIFFFGLLLFSNLIAGFTTYLLAEDLTLLVSSPIPAGRLFLVRMVSTWTQSSWMVLVFGLPVFAALGPVLDAPWWFYVLIPIILAPFTVICTAIGSVLTLSLATWLPAKRTRDVLIVLAILGFLLLYIAFRFAEPERFLQPDGFEDLISLISGLDTAENLVLPTTWALQGMTTGARGNLAEALLPVSTLYLGAVALCAMGAWLARKVYFRAFDTAQAGRQNTDRRKTEVNTLRRYARARYPGGPISALGRRDTLMFFRTTAQWTQLLLIGALVIVYLFNFKHFKSLQDAKIINSMGIFYVNFGLSGLVITTLAVRFFYPSVSLEGRALWAVRVAPFPAKTLLQAKVRWGLVPLCLLSVLLGFGSGWITDLPTWMIWSTVAISIMVTIGLTGMAVGLGALWPQFHLDNPTRIASSLGGVLFMLLGATLLIAVALLSAPPILALRDYLGSGYVPRTNQLAWVTVCSCGIICVTLLAYWLPLRLGARNLDNPN